jgi:hypothetical protein
MQIHHVVSIWISIFNRRNSGPMPCVSQVSVSCPYSSMWTTQPSRKTTRSLHFWKTIRHLSISIRLSPQISPCITTLWVMSAQALSLIVSAVNAGTSSIKCTLWAQINTTSWRLRTWHQIIGTYIINWEPTNSTMLLGSCIARDILMLYSSSI